MSKVKLKYTGSVSPAEIIVPDPDLGEYSVDLNQRQLVETGDIIEVPVELAGKAPYWRPLEEDEQRHDSLQYREKSEGHFEVYDLGHGLLGNVGAFEKVTTASAKKAETTSEKDA